MHEVNYNGRTSYVNIIIFYCRSRPEGMLYDAERDLLPIAKLFVEIWKQSDRINVAQSKNMALSVYRR